MEGYLQHGLAHRAQLNEQLKSELVVTDDGRAVSGIRIRPSFYY